MSLPLAFEHRARVEQFQRRHRVGLVTLLFTDMVGSTQMKQDLGDREAVALTQHHHSLVRQTLQLFPAAQEISTAGDSFFLVFTKPSDAVKFALRIQTRLRSAGSDTDRRVSDRIGIHVGEVFIEQEEGSDKTKDLYGIQVDTCARVMGLASASQILMTRFAFDNARLGLRGTDAEPFNELRTLQWLNHGPYLLKGLAEPIEICEVRVGIDGPATPPTSSDKAQRYVTADAEPVLGWRPAQDQKVPGTEWSLVEKLGEGGFGEVWLGRHETLKQRRVFKFCFRADRVRALKREVTLFRLLQERVGEHPNIVRLLEVFFDEPPFYLEMEYVEGKDLKSWCQAQDGVEQIPLAARLEIVARVADALQTAHEAGVIYRDVKPGNILVSGQWLVASGEEPEGSAESSPPNSPLATRYSSLRVKLTDFGIGQVVSEEYLVGVTRAGFTRTVLSPTSSHTGTQLYMAPELLAGKPASTRSDIYSLGVVLYQLLVSDFSRPLTTDWAEHISDSLLRDDLKHCFAGNPQDRFAAAAQLGKNLRALPQRHAQLAKQQAELAAREQAAYRRGVVRTAGLAVLVVVAVSALALFAFRQARRAEENAGKAKTNAALAQAEAVKSSQVAAFLKDMLKSVGPSVARGRDTTLLREVLTNTISRLDKELGDQPEVEADLRMILGKTYQDLGDYSASVAMNRRALELRRKILGERHEAVAEALNELAKPLSLQGNWTEAERLQREALAIRQKTLGPNHVVVADMLNDLGVILWNSGKLPEARAVYLDALAIKEKQLRPPNKKLADAHLNLSVLLLDLGDFAQGEGEAREALAAYRQLFGDTHPKVGMALHNQAKLLRELARLDDAERAIRQAIDVYGRVYPAGHDYHAEALDDLSLILEKKGGAKGAEAAFRDSLAMAKRVLGEDHPQTLQTTRHLALLLSRRAATLAEAEELIGRSTTLSRQKFAKQPAALAGCLDDLATFFTNTARLKEAERVLLEAYQVLGNKKQSSQQMKRICRGLEQLYAKLDRPNEAKKWTDKLAELGKE